MRRFGCSLAFMMAAVTVPAIAADVGVSVQVGQPGFYGRIDIGNFPQPQVIYRQPVLIQPVPVGVVRQPIYMRVPPGHAKHWSKHCREYNACSQPVYFVQERWYNEEYAPHYRQDHGQGHSVQRGYGEDSGHGHGKGKSHKDG